MDVTAGIAIVVVTRSRPALFLFAAVKIAREYERGVIFRLGRPAPDTRRARVSSS